MAHEVARELSVTPIEAILLGVRLAAGRVAWVDERLTAAVDEAGGAASHEVRGLLKESRAERALLARTAKAALDAGVAERLVRQVELEGRLVAEVLGRVLDRLELGTGDRARAFAYAHEELLQLEAGDPDGGATPGPGPVVDGGF